MGDDIQLVDRYIAGDEGAFEELVLRYQRQIYAVLYRMTNNVEEAKDLTQKTFFSAIKGIRDFKKRSSFKTWLYRIAVNASLNHLRKFRQIEVELEDSMISEQPGALGSLLEKEKKELIAQGLYRLPKRQRLAIILRVYDGLNCSETSSVMGCSEGAVKAHYHNGVRKLREIMKEKGYKIYA